MTKPIEIITLDIDQTVAVGRVIGRLARPGDWLTLDGELGAGKTQLVRGVAGGMGLDESRVSSPTFVLAHEYEADEQIGSPCLVHIDAYRLSGPDELRDAGLGLEADAGMDGVIVAVEWAQRVVESVGENVLQIDIAHAEQKARQITITTHGRWLSCHEQLAAQLGLLID